MDFTLDQLLTIVGRLDDRPGLDAPRERLRRLLRERMTAVAPARVLIQQAREQTGEQRHRALQDLVVLSGRLLGFDTAFGRYEHEPYDVPVHGAWRSRHRLAVSLILCTDQTTAIDLDATAWHVRQPAGDAASIGLLVMTPSYAGKDRLAQSMHPDLHSNLRLVSLSGLLRLCDLVADGRLSHEGVLQIINPPPALDARVALLEDVAASARAADRPGADVCVDDEGGPPAAIPERRCWVSAVPDVPFTAPDRIVRLLAASHQLLGVNLEPGIAESVHPGDAIAVFVAGRGIVAQGRIAAVLSDGLGFVFHGTRFGHVVRLTEVSVHPVPIAPPAEMARKLERAAADGTPVTVPLSPFEYGALTADARASTGYVHCLN